MRDSTYIMTQLQALGVPANDARILAAVAYSESGLQSDIIGDKQYGGSVGLFQINTFWHADKLKKWTGSENKEDWVSWLSDVDNNIYAAAAVYSSQGLSAWTQYRTGAYKSYLDKNYQVVSADGGSVSRGISSGFGGGGSISSGLEASLLSGSERKTSLLDPSTWLPYFGEIMLGVVVAALLIGAGLWLALSTRGKQISKSVGEALKIDS